MSLDTAPLLTRKRRLAFALEVTNNTPISLAGTDAVTPTFNPSMKFSTEPVEREEDSGSLSQPAPDIGAASAACEFETEMPGSGSAGVLPHWGRLLKMCGLADTSGTVAPVTGATQTGTLGLYNAGRLKRCSGAMGTFTITYIRAKKPRIKWTLAGVPQPAGDVSLLTPTMTTIVAPRVGGATITVGGVRYRIDQLVFDLGNKVILREGMDETDEAGNPTGYRCAYIVERRPTVKFAPEALPFSTRDWTAAYRARTTFALSLPVGTATGNTITLAAPKMVLAADPEDGDRGGLLTDQLEFVCTRNTDAGDDEFSLTFA